MSQAKIEFDRQYDMYETALSVLEKEGVISFCGIHEDVYVYNVYDCTNAIDVARGLFANKDHRMSEFRSEQEVLDVITSVWADASYRCYACQKNVDG